MNVLAHYRATNTENGPAVICEDDEPGTVMAMVGRQQDAEEIADALNHHRGAVEGAERWRNVVVAAYSLVAHDEGRSPDEIVQELREDLHDALGGSSTVTITEHCPCRECVHHGKTWEQIAAEQKAVTLPERRKMKERALTAENQLRGAVSVDTARHALEAMPFTRDRSTGVKLVPLGDVLAVLEHLRGGQ